MLFPYFLRILPGILLLLGTSCASRMQDTCPLASINIIDRDGLSETICNPDRLKKYVNIDFFCTQPYQKVLRVYKRDACGEVFAYVTSYHPNGQVKQYLEVCNGRAFGTYLEWYDSGVLKVEANVIGGMPDITMLAEKSWLFDGVNKAWDDNGTLLAEISYFKGALHGTSLYYHPNKAIWKRISYEKNELHGKMEVFLENGELFQTIEYVVGQKEGTSLRYWGPGKIASQEIYSEGKLITGNYFNLCGELVTNIDDGRGYRALFGKDSLAELQEYRNGLMEGAVKVYGTNQRLLRLYHVKNGLKHGEEIEYFDRTVKGKELQPKLSIAWYEGKIQGVVKTWYDNGVQESQRELSQNVKNGLATGWYRDGSLMLIEEYDHNKLLKGEYFKRGEKIPTTVIEGSKGIATLHDAEGNFLRRVIYLNGVPNE